MSSPWRDMKPPSGSRPNSLIRAKTYLTHPGFLWHTLFMDTPKTLADAVVYFADLDNSLKYLVAKRWPNGVECPHCDANNPMFLATRRIWKCRKCRKQFSIKTQTIFEDSPIPLNKWLVATWLISNCKNGVAGYQIAPELALTQKT